MSGRAAAALLLEGTPFERGVAHGSGARELVAEASARWRERAAGLGHDPERRTAALAAAYLPAVRARFPELLDEVAGIAHGAGLPLADVLLLNLMDEEWWFPAGEEAGCSVIGAWRDASPVLAQNMDLPDWMDGLQVVLRVSEAAGETVLLSSAGMIGLTGIRLGGVAVCVNTLLQLPRSRGGVPVAFALRAALARPDAASAAGLLASLPHASGQHYAVADRELLYGIECSAAGAALRRFAPGETLLHTNHPLWTDPAQLADPVTAGVAGVRLHSSHSRLAALEAGGPEAERETIARLLTEPEAGVCLRGTAEFPTSTFGTVIAEPAERRVSVLPGRPGAAAWIETDEERPRAATEGRTGTWPS